MSLIAVLGSVNSLSANLATGTSLTATKYAGIDGGNMQYRYFTDGTDSFREGVRDGSFVLDKTLTDTGFLGTKNTDWENLRKST